MYYYLLVHIRSRAAYRLQYWCRATWSHDIASLSTANCDGVSRRCNRVSCSISCHLVTYTISQRAPFHVVLFRKWIPAVYWLRRETEIFGNILPCSWITATKKTNVQWAIEADCSSCLAYMTDCALWNLLSTSLRASALKFLGLCMSHGPYMHFRVHKTMASYRFH